MMVFVVKIEISSIYCCVFDYEGQSQGNCQRKYKNKDWIDARPFEWFLVAGGDQSTAGEDLADFSNIVRAIESEIEGYV
jgi:hypothetical protein